MPILVVCPSCRARFQVSEKFAGRTGPCPKCKNQLQIPAAAQQVKIHGGDDFSGGGKSATGQLVLKPITRKDAKFNPTLAGIIAGSSLVVLGLAWLLSGVIGPSRILVGIGALLVSPPIVYAGYWLLRNDEIEPFEGKELYLRTLICAALYVVLWGVFAYVSGRMLTGEIWNWLFVAPPFLIIGALFSLAAYELEFGAGVFHYAFYLLLTVLLRGVAGAGWIWQIGMEKNVPGM